jgi:hypothetical protein
MRVILLDFGPLLYLENATPVGIYKSTVKAITRYRNKNEKQTASFVLQLILTAIKSI